MWPVMPAIKRLEAPDKTDANFFPPSPMSLVSSPSIPENIVIALVNINIFIMGSMAEGTAPGGGGGGAPEGRRAAAPGADTTAVGLTEAMLPGPIFTKLGNIPPAAPWVLGFTPIDKARLIP